jgi:tetratricopeptide (TPR) repeat protein
MWSRIQKILRHPAFHIFIFILLVVLAYENSITNSFVSDDRWIRNHLPNDIKTIMAMNPTIHLHQILWWLIFQFFGKVPWPYRLLNICSHTGCTILIYGIVRRIIGKRVAFLASAVFAVHPILIESIAWIAGGVYTQYTFLFLVSFYLYLLGDQTTQVCEREGDMKAHRFRPTSQRLLFLGSLIAYGLCILFSEKAIGLFLIFIAYEVSRRTFRKNWKRLVPFIGIGFLFVLYYFTLVGGRLTGVAHTIGKTRVSMFNPLIQLPLAYSMYFQLMAWPDKLSFYQSELFFSLLNYGIRVLVFMGFLAGWIFCFIKRNKLFLWLSWFIIGLLPVSTPFQVAWIVAERYVYISAIGIFVLFAIFYDRLLSVKRFRKPLVALFALIILALVVRTVYRNTDWHNEDTLWTATQLTAPSSPYTWNNMGDVYYRREDWEKAIASFRRSIALSKSYAPPYYNLGNVMERTGNIGDAILLYQKALALDPDLWGTHRQLANIYAYKGDFVSARGEVEEALKYEPNDPELKHNLTVLIQVLEDPDYLSTHGGSGLDIMANSVFETIIATDEEN